MIQIQWTCENLEEAREVSTALLQAKLVAYVSILPEVESIYLQDGEIQTSKEIKVFFKTTEGYFTKVKNFILARCIYVVPEITAISVLDGNDAYIKWVERTCASASISD